GSDVDRLYDGLAEAAAAWRCPIVGGDVSSGPVLVVSVALTGTIEGGGAPVLRSGARPGDRVFVTGPLGATAAARRVRRFARAPARVADGEAARLARATAMIDGSDGLAADVGHLAAESRLGTALDTVPVAPGPSTGARVTACAWPTSPSRSATLLTGWCRPRSAVTPTRRSPPSSPSRTSSTRSRVTGAAGTRATTSSPCTASPAARTRSRRGAGASRATTCR